MKNNCMNCALAKWERTVNGRLHPSGDGKCQYQFELPPRPKSANDWETRHWKVIKGSWISRKKPYEDCPQFIEVGPKIEQPKEQSDE